MILAYAITLLLILALILRRDLSVIARLPYRGGWKLIIGVVCLFVVQATLVTYTSGQAVWQMVLLIGAQLALIFLLSLNHYIVGVKLFILGIILNTMVMMFNGGWMPVTPETYHFVHPDRALAVYTRPPNSKNIILPRNETRLWILSDIIPLTLPWRRNAVSIGDLFLILGAGQFIFQLDLRKKEGRVIKCKGTLP